MKKLLKTFLLAVCLLVGGTDSAWAETTWKTYKTWDFVTGFAASDVSGLLPEGSWTTSDSGTSTIAEVTTTISSATAVTTTVNNRYYGIKLEGVASSSRLTLSKDGIRLGGGATKVTIPNLKKGQRITLKLSANIAISSSQLSNITVTGSSSPYTCTGIVASDGDVVLARPDNTTFYIRSILVETPIVDAVYTQEFTGATEKPADWTISAGNLTFNNNMTISLPASTNSRNGYLNLLSSASSLAGNNWSITFKAAMTPGNNKNSQEIAVWGTNSTANSQKINSISGSSVGYHIANNAFFQAYNTAASGTTYTVYFADNSMGTVTLESSKEYIFTVHCTNIDTDKKTADLQVIIIKAGTGVEVYNESHSINTDKTGTLGGLFYLNARYNSVTTFDDIYLTQSDFTLGESSKTVDIADNGAVSVTGISGNISVASANTAIATASYYDGNVTINGVAKGTTTITVDCNNNGVTTSKTIDVTVRGYDELYEEEKAPYDTKVESLDTDGQAYWTANVTNPATVTTSEAYATAVAALPATYIAAVKAQGVGSDMTDAMPEGNAGWTCNQGNGPATVKETFTETYGAVSAFVEGNIMSQTITDLQNGYYKVQFYGVVNAARSPSALTVNTDGLAQAYANSTNEEITVYYQDDCTPSDYLHTIEAQVTDGTLTYGLKAKTGVTDAGNWAVAKIYKLTYLGTDKNSYTINAVAGETTIKELATGTQWASEDYGTYIPKVILYNSKYYVLDDEDNANLDGYKASYTMGASNETKEIQYTLDESIVLYAEAENMATSGHNPSKYGTITNNTNYSNGGGIGVYDNCYATISGTVSSGVYEVTICAVTRNTSRVQSYLIEYSENNSDWVSTGISVSYTTGGSAQTIKTPSANVNIPSTAYIRFKNTYGTNAQDYLDYVLIRKLNVNDDPIIVGEIDNSTDYLTDMTDKVTLKPGESYRYQFVNHNSNGSDNTKNWVLPVYDSSDTKTIVVRADNWEDEAKANSGCTNNFNWTNFISEMDGATVDMTVSFTTDKKFTMSADIVTSTNDNWTYSYTSDYTGTAIDFSDDDYIKVALSVSLSWLEVLSEGYSTVAPTITAVNYGTYSSDYALDFEHATGVQAYYSTAAADGKIIMTKVNEAVAACEGLFIEKIDGDISIPVVASGATLTGNKLKAGGVEAPANSYVFANQGGVLGFYKLTSATNIPKGKAYLEAGSYGARLSIMFDDETTGISELKQAEQMNLNETVYNLRGQRVSQPQKGLFIVNGHKVVVK